MVKINGVRVELGEIENAIVDQAHLSCLKSQVVISCVVTVNVVDEEGRKKVTAYCVLSDKCFEEVGVAPFPAYTSGILCSSGTLLTLLRSRCKERVRKGCTPSTFVLIERIPLRRTGKIDRSALPPLESCISLEEVSLMGQQPSEYLSDYGRCGQFVERELVNCLNLHSCQKQMITTGANFAMLGGDSLAASRIVRALYASHHGVNNSRNLGGAFGQLEGAFNASRLIQAKSLGDYVDYLDSCNDLSTAKIDETDSTVDNDVFDNEQSTHDTVLLFDALVQAITKRQNVIAIALLKEGADPNLRNHGKRLGNTSGRIQQRDSFRSNPMHVACVQANVDLVRALLERNCNCKSPDSSGTYPIHLACSGIGDGIDGSLVAMYNEAEDKRRFECVRLLLDVGNVPLPMKNSSKQTVLHCAARGGHRILLTYLLKRWKEDISIKAVRQWGSKCDWQDR